MASPKALLTIVLAASILVFAGCGGGGSAADGANPADLEGGSWMLITAVGTAAELGVVDISLTFDGGAITGSSGVNSLMGEYDAKRGGQISFSNLGGTKMGAEPELMAAEQAFIAALGAVDAFAFEESALVLTGPEGLKLTFEKMEMGEVDGTAWVVAGIVDAAGNLATPIEGSSLTLEFDGAGTVQGSSGVNTFSGPYTVSENTVEVGELATTLIAAVDEALNTQETQMLSALRAAKSWMITDDILELYDANDQLVLMAVKSGD